MGNRLPTLTAEQLDDYQDATFFTRKDILRAQKRYRQLDPDRIPREMTGDEPHSISLPLKVMETLPEIQENPFRRRICQVFSSSGTGDMTFEDFLDMLNVMSEAAPRDIKVHFAFRIFDYNEVPMDLRRLERLRRLLN
ncbi:unnamed protein product [Cyprideis torosa]|uniref:Uncharacterized protein n=1 Tax=Cyprideis torosa TaxID=163714 RepID=A0A7R8W695_9CRUS|nr:unnamed protein product [Cyprideis torosa]CAG0886255.1 unnamed protein product [Cyprideis torosa]